MDNLWTGHVIKNNNIKICNYNKKLQLKITIILYIVISCVLLFFNKFNLLFYTFQYIERIISRIQLFSFLNNFGKSVNFFYMQRVSQKNIVLVLFDWIIYNIKHLKNVQLASDLFRYAFNICSNILWFEEKLSLFFSRSLILIYRPYICTKDKFKIFRKGYAHY